MRAWRTRAYTLVYPLLALALHGEASAQRESVPTEASSQVVLFVLPPGTDRDGERAMIEDALLAQFTLVDVQIVFEADPLQGRLAERITRARERGENVGAFAVCWLDASDDDEWLLYLMDLGSGRLLVRPVEAGVGREAAASEAVAVVTRDSAQALLRDGRLPEPAEETQPDPEPEPEPAPEQTEPAPAPVQAESGVARISAGYSNTDFADRQFQHGIAFELAYAPAGAGRVFVGLGYMLSPLMHVESNTASFDLGRHPIRAFGGYRLRAGSFAVDASLGLTVEILYRSSSEAAPPGPIRQTTMVTQSRARALVAASPRVRVELAATSTLGFYASVGIDLIFNHFEYVATPDEGGAALALLDPNSPRLVPELGLAIYP